MLRERAPNKQADNFCEHALFHVVFFRNVFLSMPTSTICYPSVEELILWNTLYSNFGIEDGSLLLFLYDRDTIFKQRIFYDAALVPEIHV